MIHKDNRRQGLGKKLLARTVAALGDRNITLYGSPEGVPFYRKYGFSSEEEPTYLYQTRFVPKKDVLKGLLILAHYRQFLFKGTHRISHCFIEKYSAANNCLPTNRNCLCFLDLDVIGNNVIQNT